MAEFECTDQCKEDQNQYKKALADFCAKYPDFCRKCDGLGYICYQYDPSPPGVSLSSGYMEDCDPCPDCEGADEPICGLCGKLLKNEQRACECPYTCAPQQPECWCWEASLFDDVDSKLATGPRCPHCGSDQVTTEQPRRSKWVTVKCGGCGEESEIPAERDEPAAERY